jgi:ornithine--oxo-acid transaminase
MHTDEILYYEKQHGARNYTPLEVVLTRGEGVWVYDLEGRRYLDGLSAYSALNHGHCHPRLVEALTRQAQRLTLTSRAFHTDQYPLLLHRLAQLTGYDAALLMNSGVEGVETALKLARKWAYTVKGVPLNQAEIIVAENNFHGRTVTALSFSTEPLYRTYFGPYTPGFKIVPYGDSAAMAAAITPYTAAVLVEPIQGEAGVVMPPAGYLSRISALCQETRTLLILDEIQTGLGRTGKFFAHHYEDVRPDVVIIGKALGGGMYPVSGILADRLLMDVFQSGEHGSTFGGNPLAAAVAIEALNVLVEEELCERSTRLGEYALTRLQALLGCPLIKEVRGRGLFIGIELVPEAGGARRFCEILKDRGILCKETHENVVRFAPPLIIEQNDLDVALETIMAVFQEAPDAAVSH